MKKLVSFLVLFVMLATVATAVNATTSNTLSDELYAMGKKYGMTAEHKVKIDRYLADNEVTDEQANEIVAKAEAAIQVMKDAGTTSYSKLTADQKEQIKTIAIEAADVLDLTLSFSNKRVNVYQNGKLIDSASLEKKAAYTGNSTSLVLVVSSVVVVALVAGYVARKKFANA